jgi:DNA (cytosine-5)-methyltransferase 1
VGWLASLGAILEQRRNPPRTFAGTASLFLLRLAARAAIARNQRQELGLLRLRSMGAALIAVDLFAGAGGFSTGARAAGASIAWAANHSQLAVDTHERNHPETKHKCQDLHQADWSKVPAHDLLLASPACQGHSSASLGQRIAKHDADRSTAWAVVSAIEFHRPRFVVVENVPRFRSWRLYQIWLEALRAYGYSLTENLLDAADFGVAQSRLRLFVVGSLGAPISIAKPRRKRRCAGDVLRFDAGDWKPIKSKTAGVRSRVKAGRKNFGDRFLTQHVTNHPGRSLDRPIGTITTKQHWAIVKGSKIRMVQPAELRELMGFPRSYLLPAGAVASTNLLGNAVCPPVAKSIVRQLMLAD